MENLLRNSLKKLAKETIDIVDQLKNEDKITQENWMYEIPICNQFEFDKDGHIICSFSFDYEERFEWQRHQMVTIWANAHELPSFPKIVEEIVTAYNKSTESVPRLLRTFVERMAWESLHGLSDEETEKKINLLIEDLKGSEVKFNPVVGFRGIWINDDSYELSNNMKFRRPKFEDGHKPRKLDTSSFPTLIQHDLDTDCFMEFTKNFNHSNDVQNYVEKFAQVLRLFKVGSIKVTTLKFNPNSFQSLGGTQGTLDALHGRYRYELKKNELAKLSTFISRIFPFLPRPYPEDTEFPSDLKVALDRYNDALLKPFQDEQILSYGIMALEALFLRSEEKSELRFKLSIRTSKILSYLDYDALEISKKVKKAYGIRSQFVHGEYMKSDKQDEINDLTYKIMNYVSQSIVLMLQLRGKIKKDELLKKLDNSLLSDEVSNDLKLIIKNNCIAL